MRKLTRRSDAQMNLARSWHPGSLGPGSMRSVDVTGYHGIARPGNKQSDARLEFAQLSSGRARAFGKKDQDVIRIIEELPAQTETLARTGLALKRHRVDHDGG